MAAEAAEAWIDIGGGLSLSGPPRESILVENSDSGDALAPKIISMCARGMTAREIITSLRGQLGWRIGDEVVLPVIAAQLDLAQRWRARPVERFYPIISFASTRFTLHRHAASSEGRMIIATAICADGTKDVLGLWASDQADDSVRFVSSALDDLKSRGLRDALILVTDDASALLQLKPRFEQAHIVASVAALTGEFAPAKRKREFTAVLRKMILLPDDVAARHALRSQLDELLGADFSNDAIRRRMELMEDCLAVPPALRRITFMSEPLDGTTEKLRRRGAKLRTHFRSPKAALQSTALVLWGAAAGWKVDPHQWISARQHLTGRCLHQTVAK